MSREDKLFIVGIIILTCVMGMVMKVVTSNVVAKRMSENNQCIVLEDNQNVKVYIRVFSNFNYMQFIIYSSNVKLFKEKRRIVK